MIYNRFNREISCHHVTVSLHHSITASLCQSVICLAPCHQTSQSFALPPTTASLCHRVSQSFALPPATKPVSHLPCPLPPNQPVICLAPYHCITASLRHCATAPPCHCITVSPHHRVTMPLHHHVTTSPHHCVTRITTSPCHCISQSFALPPATKPVSHLPCPLPPNQSVICLAPYHRITASLRHRITASLRHHTTVSPCHRVTASLHHCITASPCHRVTALVSHLPCPLPPSQSVIYLAPCHQTSQSFALPPTTASPHHHAITSLHHHITTSLHHHITLLVSHLPCPLPPSQSVICLAPCHQASQSFALPPATKPVSHLPCPLPPHHHVTASPH